MVAPASQCRQYNPIAALVTSQCRQHNPIAPPSTPTTPSPLAAGHHGAGAKSTGSAACVRTSRDMLVAVSVRNGPGRLEPTTTRCAPDVRAASRDRTGRASAAGQKGAPDAATRALEGVRDNVQLRI